jgi:hypothetical protein
VNANSHSDTSTQWSYVHTPTWALGRRAQIKMKLFVTVTAGANNQDVKSGSLLNKLFPVCKPLNQCMNIANLTINNVQENANVSMLTGLQSRFQKSDNYYLKLQSTCPSYPDIFNNGSIVKDFLKIADTTPANEVEAPLLLSLEKNPYSSGSYSNYSRRSGGFSVVEIQSKSTTKPQILKVSWETTEDIDHPILSDDPTAVMMGVSQFSLNITWHNLNHSFQLLDNIYDAAGNTCVVSKPSFESGLTSAVLLLRSYRLPIKLEDNQAIAYDFYRIIETKVAVPDLKFDEKRSVTVNGITSNVVPDYVFVMANEVNSVRDDPKKNFDCFARLDNLKIDTENAESNFGGASPEELYQISARNGLNMSHFDYTTKLGSIFCADIKNHSDVPGYTSGLTLKRQLNWSATATLSNVSYKDLGRAPTDANRAITDYELRVLLFIPCKLILKIGGNTGDVKLGVSSDEGVLNYSDVFGSVNYYGGKWSWKNSNLNKWIRAIAKGFKKVNPFVQAASQLMPRNVRDHPIVNGTLQGMNDAEEIVDDLGLTRKGGLVARQQMQPRVAQRNAGSLRVM